ncbi:MAG: HAMP domain-containing protein [Chitinivibrionales bacterium]|nr:HAMP domain-containing protein [Chitinivibrionales bacterium]
MLRTRLLKYFGILVIVFGALSAFIGVQVVRKEILTRANTQVLSDLNSAWSVMSAEMEKLEMVLKMTSDRPQLVDACNEAAWKSEVIKSQLEKVRMRYGLDFLSVADPKLKVVMRGAPPYNSGDYFRSEPALTKALQGSVETGIALMNSHQLNREQGHLAEKAFMVLEETPRARPTQREAENRGMVMISAVPITNGNGVKAVLYGGVVLNRNTELVQQIKKAVFKDERYEGNAMGTVTIFLKDCRIATTVLDRDGQRAIGTRVSKEVADRVLDNGKSWLGRAFVVKDWYVTAYDPIRNTGNEIIGMLYVGILEKPFVDMIRNLVWQYAALSAGAILVTLILAFFFAEHVSRPLHLLADAANKMRTGHTPETVTYGNCSKETGMLIDSFNDMAKELTERENKLKVVNEDLQATNASYMETLGFISHELKTPIGSIMNYVYLLGEQKFGDLNQKQINAVRNIDRNTKRITEMVRHYLNLSRIENKELRPIQGRLDLGKDVIEPLMDSFDAAIAEKGLKVANNLRPGLLLNVDYNLTLEVFENLLSNAVKYGNEGGTVTLSARKKEDMVEFSVHNSGEGIAEEHLPEIFGKFFRVNEMQKGKMKKGTGLGLFITRHIVEAHGGTISVRSEKGNWTEFVFTLPAYVAKEEVVHA